MQSLTEAKKILIGSFPSSVQEPTTIEPFPLTNTLRVPDKKKVLVISDIHLSHIFQPTKFAFLKKIIKEADQVIINGDFWEGYLSSFDQFVNSPWQDLFPLLKSRDTIYLYGNHDPEEKSDARRDLFSVWQGDTFDLQSGSRVFHIQHGHRIVQILLGDHPHLPRFILGILPTLEARGKFLPKRQPFLWYARYNKKMKKWVERHLEAPTILVTGHTHLPELALEKRFVNSGIIKWGFAQRLVIEAGEIQLLFDRYHTK